MKTLSFRSGLVVATALVAGLAAQAQTAAPRSDAMTALCRVKAKESANLAFRSCMSESKTGEVEAIRREYQEKLSAIKAEYEKELGRVSGKGEAKPAATEESKSFEKETGDAESDLMKNAILDELTDEIQPRQQLIRKASKGETASRGQLEKREPKEPDAQGPRVKRGNVKPAAGKSQLAAAGRPSKAILFNDGMELPEPIPVEASFGATHQ